VADHTIGPDQQGAYEINIPAGQTVTVHVGYIDGTYATDVQVIAHNGTSPVYARIGDTVQPKQPDAYIVGQGNWTDIDHRVPNAPITIAIASETDAIASVVRR
jgi:hypothetical protein